MLRANIRPGNNAYEASFKGKFIVDGSAFRVRQNDYDGAFTYSPLATLHSPSCATEAAGISVYPQPARDRLFIKLPLEEPTTVELRDLTGRVVFSRKVTDGSANLSVAGLPAGVYLLSGAGGKIVRQVVIE